MLTEIAFKQRAYDGKWEYLGRFTVGKYEYKDQDGKMQSIEETKWITMGVYDYLMEDKG